MEEDFDVSHGRCVLGVAKAILSVQAQKHHPYHSLECCLHSPSPLFHHLLSRSRKKYKLKIKFYNL